MGDEGKKYSSDDVATILEFFGIKLTTPNQEFAEILKTDVGDLLHTDVKALFARYRATIDDLRTKNPGTTFVHVTAPLTVVQGGVKENLKRLLGRAPYGTIENMRREEYNTLLRQAYREREPIFDLARVESTAPDGTVVTTEWKGSVAPAMAPAYTDDGGHLNAAGKLRAARELVSVLAAIPGRPAVGGPAR